MIKFSFYQIFSNIISAIILILLLSLLSKNFGVYDFGRYQLAVTIGTFSFLFQDFGFKNLIFKEYTQSSSKTSNIIHKLFSTALFHLFFSTIFLIIIVLFFKERWLWSFSIIFYGLNVLFYFISNYLKAKGEFILDAKWNVFFKIITSSFVIITGIFFKITPNMVFILEIIGAILCFILIINKITLPFNFFAFNKGFYKFSISFFLIDFFTQVYFRTDSFLITYFKGYSDNGIYSASFRIIEGINYLISPIMFIFFQKLRKSIKEDKIFKIYFKKFLTISLIIGFFVLTTGFFLSKFIINLIYGANFSKSIIILKLLFIGSFFMIVNFLFTQTLIAKDKENYYLKLVILLSFINISLNFILIPFIGIVGAAISTIITEIILFIGSLIKILKINNN